MRLLGDGLRSRVCRENGAAHHLTNRPPLTSGQVERMNRTLQRATFKCYPDKPGAVPGRLQLSLYTYNLAGRLNTSRAHYGHVPHVWTKRPTPSDSSPHGTSGTVRLGASLRGSRRGQGR
jgi:hypothetical protein